MILMNYIAAFFLIVLGLYTIVTKYNLVKTVIGLSIMDYGVNLLIVSIGFNPGGTAPIFIFLPINKNELKYHNIYDQLRNMDPVDIEKVATFIEWISEKR